MLAYKINNMQRLEEKQIQQLKDRKPKQNLLKFLQTFSSLIKIYHSTYLKLRPT